MSDRIRVLKLWNYSQIAEFQRCQMSWHFRYRECLVPRQGKPSMDLGTLVHVGIAAFLQSPSPGYDPLVKAIVDKSQELTTPNDEERKEMVYKACHIATRAMQEFPPSRWQTVSGQIEQRLQKQYGSNLFHGTPDWIAWDLVGESLWIIDWKVRKSIAPYRSDLDVQALLYQRLAVERFANLSGSINVQLLADIPQKPKLNKGGKSMSRAAIRTTWEIYSAALEEAGLDPAQYSDMQQSLGSTQWVAVNYVPHQPANVEVMWNHAKQVIDKMRRCKHPTRAFSTIACGQCPYLELCLERAKTLDTAWLEQEHFTQGE